MDIDRVTALVNAEAAQQARIEKAAVARVQATYDELDWYDHAAITVVAAEAGALARAASSTAAATTDAYLTQATSEVLGRPQRPAGAMRLVEPLRMNVSGWGAVYGRVADTVRFEVAQGKPLATAVEIGMQRADALVQTDLALARREQGRRTLSANPRVVGYRRVVHPELSATGTCGLCIAAADRRYHTDRLLPIHARCVCTMLPITTAHDPGGILNQQDFAEAYRLAGDTSARALKEVRVRVVEHGELGPVLLNAEHRSTDTGKYRRAREARRQPQIQRPDTRAESQAFRATAQRSLND